MQPLCSTTPEPCVGKNRIGDALKTFAELLVSTLVSALLMTSAALAGNARLGTTDFRTMTAAQVVETLKNADQVRVTRASSAHTDAEWLEGCNGRKRGHFSNNSIERVCYQAMGPVYQVQHPDAGILLQNMEALFRGCGIYALTPDDSSGGSTCGILGRTFYVIGNMEAARAVWESKGCYALDNVGRPVNGCMAYIVGRSKNLSDIIGFGDPYHGTSLDSSDAYQSSPEQLKLMARMACDSVHDRASCEYLIREGESADMDAVEEAGSRKMALEKMCARSGRRSNSNAGETSRTKWRFFGALRTAIRVRSRTLPISKLLRFAQSVQRMTRRNNAQQRHDKPDHRHRKRVPRLNHQTLI